MSSLCSFLIIGKILSLDTIQQLGFVLGLCYFFHIIVSPVAQLVERVTVNH